MPTPRHLLASAALALLAACGGGGGGGTSGGGGVPAAGHTAPVPISAANQVPVARAAIDVGLAVTRVQSALGADGRAAAQAAPAAAQPPRPAAVPAVLARGLLMALAQRHPAAAPSRASALAVSTETDACSLGGSITATFDDRDNNGTESAGDVLTAVFSQCEELASVRIDGTFIFALSAVSSSASREAVDGTVTFQQVAVTVDQTRATINGSVVASVVATSSSTQVVFEVASAGMAVSASAGGRTETVQFAPATRFSMTITPTSAQVALQGTLTSTTVGGSFVVATPVPVRQLAGDTHPSSGQVVVTGAGGSQLRITVLDRTQLRLELDANGDGQFESTTIVPWASLASA